MIEGELANEIEDEEQPDLVPKKPCWYVVMRTADNAPLSVQKSSTMACADMVEMSKGHGPCRIVSVLPVSMKDLG